LASVAHATAMLSKQPPGLADTRISSFWFYWSQGWWRWW